MKKIVMNRIKKIIVFICTLTLIVSGIVYYPSNDVKAQNYEKLNYLEVSCYNGEKLYYCVVSHDIVGWIEPVCIDMGMSFYLMYSAMNNAENTTVRVNGVETNSGTGLVAIIATGLVRIDTRKIANDAYTTVEIITDTGSAFIVFRKAAPISEQEGQLKLSSATYKYGLTTKNLLNEVYCIETDHNNFTLACAANNPSSVISYQLYSGTTKIATSSNGKFENLDPSKFTVGEKVSVKTIGSNRTVTTTLLLQIKKKSVLKDASIELGGDELSFTVPSDVPILGDTKLNFSLPEIPVTAIIEGGRIKIGFNIKEKNLYSSNSYEGVTTTTKEKTMAQKVADWKADIYKSGLISKDIKGYLEQANLAADIPGVSKSCSLTVFGYAEGTWSDSLETVSGEIVVAISASATAQHQFAILSVPVTVNIKTTGKGQVGASVTYNFVDNELSGDVDLSMSIALEPYLGVGVGTWFSAGIYGKAEVGMGINLVTVSSATGVNGPGLDNVYLYGEAGLKAYFAKKEVAKLPIISTKNLKKTNLGKYLNSSNQLLLYSRTENSLLNKIEQISDELTSLPVPQPDINDMDVMFEWSESEKSQYISPVPELLDTTDTNVLIDNVYGASTPQIVTIGNKTVIAYVDEDSERATANQTKAQYIVYDSSTETFTEPTSIIDDGTSDFDLQLYSDGINIYVYYLDSTKTFSEDDDSDIEEYAGSFGVTVAKFDSETNNFINLGKFQVDNKYCYTPSLTGTDEGFILTWVENEDNQIMGLTNNNSVYYAVYDGNTVSEPTKVLENLNSVTSIAAVSTDDIYKIAYCVDVDNDITTDEQSLYIKDINGNLLNIDTGVISSLEYMKLPGLEQEAIALIEDGVLSYVNFDTNEINVLDETALIDNGSEYTVIGNKIYYLHTETTLEESSRNVAMLVYENEAFTSVDVTDETDYVDGYATDGEWLIYQNTEASIDDEDNIITSYELKINRDLEKHDLVLDYADYDSSELQLSSNLPVTLEITNNGTTTVKDIKVTVSDKYGYTVAESDFEVNIAPGATMTESIDVLAPGYFRDNSYTINVSELYKEDIDNSDNEAIIDFSFTDLAVNATYVLDEDENKYIKVSVSNESYLDTEAAITATDIEGNNIYEGTESVEGQTENVILIPITEEMMDNKNAESIYTVTVTTEDNEFYECNNICDVSIWDVEPVMIEVKDIIENGIEINGYQINSTASGMRTVYSIESEINNQKVVNSGIIYSLSDYVEESDLYIGSDNYYVKNFESTTAGLSSVNYSKSETANSYAMTMMFATKTAEERNCKFTIRAYAQLEDGSYVYSNVYTYDAFSVAKELYENSLMSNSVSHDYLYENILSIVDSGYIKIPYNSTDSIVQAE